VTTTLIVIKISFMVDNNGDAGYRYKFESRFDVDVDNNFTSKDDLTVLTTVMIVIIISFLMILMIIIKIIIMTLVVLGKIFGCYCNTSL
jgi:hypothetical protein